MQSEKEKRVESLVDDEMRLAGERGILVAVTDRDHDHVEVDIQRSETTPWLRFYVDPHASENDARQQIRAALSSEGDLRGDRR